MNEPHPSTVALVPLAANIAAKPMKDVKVLGTGCRNCHNTQALIEDVAKAKGVELRLEKVDQIADIMRWGVLSTPGVVIDGKVVHSGGVPNRKQVEAWLA